MDGTLTTNWTNEVEPLNSASGFASPFNYTYNTTGNWRFTSGGMSGNALSDSTSGSKYRERTLKRIRYNSAFNLTGATAAYLSFYTKHALDNFKDKVQVQVSTNGTTWTAINGKTTVKEPGTPNVADESTLNGLPALTGIQPDWVQEEFNLATYLGQATVYIRFEFTSDPTESFWAAEDEGIFIDNLKVISTNTTLQTLAANFLSFTGKLQNDNTIELKWEASTDRDHAYFEVEKSADRITFNSIGRVTGNSNPYTLIDPSPFVGNNFYRIKAVDNAGKAEYSTVINVLYNPSLHFLQTYPNPANDVLNVRLKMSATERIQLQVADLSGRIVSSKEVVADNNLKTYQINTETLVANMYVLKITNSKGEIIGIQKFVKQ
jgi:hypothetical protein